MLRPRFAGLALRYGCHDNQWALPDMDRPLLIVGPNGSGKTTLIDGLIRILFGFDRRRPDDVAEAESRHPWGHDMMRGQVVVARNGQRYEIRRDFVSNQVRIHDPGDGVDHFIGDGNPAARNQEARHYRQILTDLLGLRDLAGYRDTLLIRQGALSETALGDHLLRVAAGGHARVETARREIAHSHRAVTRRPLHSSAAAAINPRELEKLEDEIADVRARLEAASRAGQERGPLALDRDRTAARLATLEEEIELLEEALSALAHTGSAELLTRRARQQIRELDAAEREVTAAAEELEAARAACRDAMAGGAYPHDLPQRLARAEIRWRDIEESRRSTVPPLGVAGLALLALAAALLLVGEPVWAAAAATAGLLASAAWTALHLVARRRRRHAHREVAKELEDVPEGADLGPASVDAALARYRAQEAALDRKGRARNELADALRDARALLAQSDAAPTDAKHLGGHTAAVDDPGGDDRELPQPAARVVDRLRSAAEATREGLARGQVELERIGELSLRLPPDVPPTEEAVTEALRSRRAERSQVQETLSDVSQALLERGTPSESIEALETLLASLDPRREALLRKAEVLEAAHALITDAYDAFRDRDQDRLVGRVSHHVSRLANGSLEGVEVRDSLDEARVRTGGRSVAMGSPPLSFGEFHALQLGVRLGAADFLSGIGITPPLVVDDPFAHLDEERSRALWALLVDVARERQVVVTTHDTLLLREIGVSPTIDLTP